MSAFKNLIKTRKYKERAQPSARAHLGLLEKKKDYALRARDFRKKERRLRAMKEKAALRNPDEFYFSMQSKELNKDGLHRIINDESFTNDEIKLMRTQDISYVSSQLQSEKNKIEKLKSNLHYLSADKSFKHTVFLESSDDDDGEESREQVNDNDRKRRLSSGAQPTNSKKKKKKTKKFDPVEYFDTVPEALNRTYNRPRRSQLENELITVDRSAERRKLQAESNKRYELLEGHEERLKKLSRVKDAIQTRLDLQSGRDKRKKVVDKSAAVNGIDKYRWENKRKK